MLGCTVCGGTGLKVVHRAGDPVPGHPQNDYTRTVYASTVYTTCECCILRLGPWVPPPDKPSATRFERVR